MMYIANNKISIIKKGANDFLAPLYSPLSIRGVTRKIGVQTASKIRLYGKNSGQLVQETISNESGHYEFKHLAKIRYMVVAIDHTSTFNAVIQDNVVPK